jgi:hypothetical protein
MMGKPDTFDRIAQGLVALIAILAFANGAFMLVDPLGWYSAAPNVNLTGPANQHFIRDIGVAYLVSCVLLGYAAFNLSGRWQSAFAGSLWLIGHALVHIGEVAVGNHHLGRFWQDSLVVLWLPLLIWGALAILLVRQRISPAGLPKTALLGVVDKMSPDESAYLHEIANAPGHPFEKFTNFMPVTMHRWASPADLFHMARIGAIMIEDCGPCAHTAARGALDDGVGRDLVNLALSARPPSGNLTIAFDFGQAIASHSESAADLGDEIEARFGRPVRLELSMTAATVRAYPAMKRGLGLSKSCSLVSMEV